MSKELSKYFKFDEKNDCVFFIGDKLLAHIPMRYESKNLLIIESKISALGIFTMTLNDKITCGFQMPAVITMDPSNTYSETVDGDQFFVCEFNKNDKFMISTTILMDNKLAYLMYLEFLSLGNMPKYITYKNVVGLFDDLEEIAGAGLPVDHVVWELIYAHVFRDSKDITVPYRHTPMTKPPVQITLRDVAHGASSTQARMLGAFADDGRNAALLNQADQNHELEDFWRL